MKYMAESDDGMAGTPFKLNFRIGHYGDLWGIESAFRVDGDTTPDLVRAIEAAGYKWHSGRACWYTHDRVARLLLTDNLAVLARAMRRER